MRYAPYALIAVFMVAYIVGAIQSPDGQWDGFAIWNAKARLWLYHDPLEVLRVSLLPHKDYPPLLSLVIYHGYLVFGDVQTVPIVVHGAVFAGLLWMLRYRLWTLAIVGAVALPYSVTMFADLTLALCFLGAVIAYRHERPLWVGFALGCGVLVKNEGSLMALVFVGVWIVSARRIPYRTLLVLAPFVVCLLLYRQVVPEQNDIMGSSGMLERLTDVSRYGVILPMLISMSLGFGGGAFGVLGAVLWLQRRRVRVSMPLVTVALILVGYVGIYAITPHDVAWHIGNSWDRLLLQLWPVAVYELFR